MSSKRREGSGCKTVTNDF